MDAVRYYAENSAMKDSVCSTGMNTRFIVIVNHYFSVHSWHVPHRYIDKLNSDMFSNCTINTTQVLDDA